MIAPSSSISLFASAPGSASSACAAALNTMPLEFAPASMIGVLEPPFDVMASDMLYLRGMARIVMIVNSSEIKAPINAMGVPKLVIIKTINATAERTPCVRELKRSEASE